MCLDLLVIYIIYYGNSELLIRSVGTVCHLCNSSETAASGSGNTLPNLVFIQMLKVVTIVIPKPFS